MKALNRKEALVNAKANGTLDSFNPLTRDEAFTKKALGLGGGASSWNDLTDKPFGEEVEIKTIWNDFSVEMLNDVDQGLARNNPTPSMEIPEPFKVGATYTVMWDGSAYSNLNTYVDEEGCITLGTPDLIGFTDELPFVLYCYPSETDEVTWQIGINARLRDADFTVKVSIIEKAETIKTLDTKFLPVMTVNMTGNEDWTLTCDKTYDEIDAHISAGGIVEAVFYRKTSSTPYYATLSNKSSTGFNFYATNWGYAGEGALKEIRMMAMFVCFDPANSGWAESYLSQTIA